jgi:non-ribosomal peptide synthase protein (TIGR01720 family)
MEQEISLSSKTTSLQLWAERLKTFATSEDIQDEIAYWSDYLNVEVGKIKVDHPGGSNLEQNRRIVSVKLPEEMTKSLLQDVPSAYKTEINDILLTALAQLLVKITKEPNVIIELEGHGREQLFDDIDVSRTIGWFTSMYPLILKIDRSKGIGDVIKSVKEQIRAVPHSGIGFGLLRYLAGQEIQTGFADIPQPEISFNYLGQFDRAIPDSGIFKIARETRGTERHGLGMRHTLIDITGGIMKGCLTLNWSYSIKLFNSGTIERIANQYRDNLMMIIEHCTNSEIEGFTPSDFPLAGLDQKELDKLLGKIKR